MEWRRASEAEQQRNACVVAYLVFDPDTLCDRQNKLPYTAAMLARRHQRGADVPEWYTTKVIEISVLPGTPWGDYLGGISNVRPAA